MQLVTVEAPPLGMPVALRAQAPKFGDLLLRLVLARQLKPEISPNPYEPCNV
jgi:hypothetical protein